MLTTVRAERKAGMERASGDDAHSPVVVPPLAVSGLVVSKADLVVALRVYVPNLVDVTPLDGDRFLLSLAQADGWLQYAGTLDTIKNKADWVGVHCYWPTGYWDDDAVSGHLDRGRWYRMVRQILHDGGVPDPTPLIITEYGNGDELGVCDQTCKGNEYRDWLNQVWADVQAGWGVEQCQAFITQTCTLENPDWDRFILVDPQIDIMSQGGGG